ncbi:hypothetical protein Droror1_Dr00021600 [Drosera rotundifolia]
MSWLRTAVNKAVEVGKNKNNLTRSFKNFGDSMALHAGQTFTKGAKLFQNVDCPTPLSPTTIIFIKKGDDNVKFVAVDEGESMMDKEEIVCSDSEVDEDEQVEGKANLEKADLEPVLKALKDRLMTKNVVADVIDMVFKSYAREGRLPVLGSNLNDFLLYCPDAESEALSPWETIGAKGCRNFMLCKKPQMTPKEATTGFRFLD